MCTVTVVPHGRGMRVLCNRDERRSRPAALPPHIHDLGGHRAVFPVDPQGGGTWIGVNDADVVVALLNIHKSTHVTDDRPKRSRGLVVPELLRAKSLPAASATVEALDTCAFEPFQVVIVHDGRVTVATNDPTAGIRSLQRTLDRPLLFTSSSLGDTLATPPRRRLFERMVVRSRTGWLNGQAQFHDHQWPARPDISIRMERRDALTVSRTTIEITEDRRELLYEAPLAGGAPDRVRECRCLP